jgi:hypothetical protein
VARIGKLGSGPSSVTVGCFAAFVIDEARKGGFSGFADKLENCFAEFLKGLPADERMQTLMLSHQYATAEIEQEPVKLKLVYSRP